jgi:hypothetical protein
MMKEESRAVASTFSLAYWSALLLMSGLLIALIADPSAVIIWGVFTLFLSFAASYYRTRAFLKSSRELLTKGQVASPYDLKRQHKLLLLLILLTVAAFFVPLFLSAALDSSLWIGSLLGVIDGWILGLLLYNLFLFRWQKKNNGELFILETWTGNKVTHLGLTFAKRGRTRE